MLHCYIKPNDCMIGEPVNNGMTHETLYSYCVSVWSDCSW
jgi:hypothetical protein